MNLKVEYWMLGELDQMLSDKKIMNMHSNWSDHMGCSTDCLNRYCRRYGMINLIRKAIRELKDEVNKGFEEELQSGDAK